MTVLVFDVWKKVRAVIPENGVTDLVHDEVENTLTAAIPQSMGLVPGEHIGFECIDGKFRLFAATKVENKDFDGTSIVTATDAIVQELKETIVEDLQQLDVTVTDAVKALLTDERWYVTGYDPGTLEKSRAYYTSVWDMLKTFETLYQVRIIPYYQHIDGEINLKVLEIEKDEAVFRGRILQSQVDASNVYVIKNNAPITRLYGLGPAQGSTDVQTNLTFAAAVWSAADGDPTDKPEGQTWVEDPEAVAKYGVHTAVVSFTDAEDEDDLLKKTWDYLQTVKEPTGTIEANVSDLETVPGYEHQIIRLGDLVPIRLKTSAMEEARVVGLKRNYIKKSLTKITVGDKLATIKSQVSTLITSATHTFERLTIYQNRFHEDEALIQLNAEFIQLNAEAIEANALQIRLNAEELLAQADLISAQAEQISAKADAVDVEAVTVRINAVETEILGLLKVENLRAAIADLSEVAVSDLSVAGTADCTNLNVHGAASVDGDLSVSAELTCAGLTINGDELTKMSLTVVTGIDVITSLEGNITAVQPVTTQFYYFA